MPDVFYFILMLFAGAFVAMQPLINTSLAVRVGPVGGALVSFGVGTIALGAVAVFTRQMTVSALLGASWWQFAGGLLGAFYVTTLIFVTPRIGVTAALAATIASQLMAGALLDHYGFLGGRHIPIDAWRVAGILLLFAGAGLVLKG